MIGKLLTTAWRAMAASSGARPGPLDDFWYQPAVLSALPFTAEQALQLSVTQDCLSSLANPIASLPLHIFARQPDGSRRRVDNHPIAALLSRQANDLHTAYEFLSIMQWQLGWHKNAVAEILPGPRGAVDRLIPHDWRRVRIDERDGERRYIVRDSAGSQRVLRADEVWHLRAPPFTDDGLAGRPVYETGRDTFAYAIAVQQYGAQFFANSGKSGGVIKMPGNFRTPEERDKFLAAWRASRTGLNAHKDRVLEFGADYVPLEVKNNEAQFRESKMDAARAVARLWNIPPHKIGDLERATFSNIEQQSIEFVQDVLLPWLTLWEQAIARDLILAPDTFFAEFDVAGLLKGDLKSRFEAYAKAIQSGWMTVNEVRRKENLDPAEGGDTLLRPLNMTPSDAGAETSARAAALTVLREATEKEAA